MKKTIKRFYFKQYEAPNQSPFEKPLWYFQELITHTSGFDEAIDWLKELDKEYKSMNIIQLMILSRI
jgi:hypothetical protein